ncbi:MAG: hypothetical protein ABIH20_03640 [Candidatus Diapherotrites archaeon]
MRTASAMCPLESIKDKKANNIIASRELDQSVSGKEARGMENTPKIDLFKLHDPKVDDKPKKWICANGAELKQELKNLIDEACSKLELSKARFSELIAKKLNVSVITAERIVYQRKEWVPLIFMQTLLDLTENNDKKFQVISKIDFLKASQPPLRIVKAPKTLTKNLCKIAGAHAADGSSRDNFFCITDGHKSNLIVFKKWIHEEFGFNYPVNEKSPNEWEITFNNKVFSRYLQKIFEFPNGNKCKTVGMPKIIKKSKKQFRKAFAIGALSFEAGVGMKHQIEFCVSSKNFLNDLTDVFLENKIKHVKMTRTSCKYWRFWSGALSNEEAEDWKKLFEPNTEKWHKLNDSIKGYTGKVNSFQEAIDSFKKVYPKQGGTKIQLIEVLKTIKKQKETYRYKIIDQLLKDKNLKSYGGKWGHSIKFYIDILKMANIISIKKGLFPDKFNVVRSVRHVYTYNPNISEWVVPERPDYEKSNKVL